MAEGPFVRLSGVGVRFRIPAEPIASFKEYVIRKVTRGIPTRELWAVREVDLTLDEPGIVGIVGHNGAGKSTLLKVVCRVLRPTTGRVVVRGRVAPLLELGAGFHPDLTGRENIFLNASLLGYPLSLVREGYDELVRFAELEDFIHLPIRNLSSGMQARLGFAVATLMRPDILILDEVLAVGDAEFQRKCLDRVEEFIAAGTLVLFVSHVLDTVASRCRTTLWLDHGRLVAHGPTDEILERYRESVGEGSSLDPPAVP